MTNKILLLIGMLAFQVNILMSQDILYLDSTNLTKYELVTGLLIPWEITWGPDDHIWATERPGTVVRIEPSTGNYTEVLDIRFRVVNEDEGGFGSEYGMLGMAFHPDFENTPKVYIAYTWGPPIIVRLSSFDWDGEALVNEEILLNNIEGATYHNGSRLVISPDEKIMMTTGDASNPILSQDTFGLNGKVLRLNLDGSIPDDNPYPDSYVYSIGHRNSQGLVYSPDGILYSSEHGNLNSDELNIIQEKGNYGWPYTEGECNTGVEIGYCNDFNIIEPLTEWSPCVAVNGIDFYDHDAIPEWKGKILMAVLGGAGFIRKPRVSVLSLSDDGLSFTDEELFFENYGRIRDLCINPHTGAIYFATNGNAYPGSGPNQIIEYRNDAATVSVDPELSISQDFKIVPNPARDVISLNVSPQLIGAKYKIISYNGSIVLEGAINNIEHQIEISDLSIGNYYIVTDNALGKLTRTFSVIR